MEFPEGAYTMQRFSPALWQVILHVVCAHMQQSLIFVICDAQGYFYSFLVLFFFFYPYCWLQHATTNPFYDPQEASDLHLKDTVFKDPMTFRNDREKWPLKVWRSQ